MDQHVCHIEGPLLSNSICNNYATKKAPGALYRIEKDEFACHPFKPTGTQKPTFDFFDKLYIGNPHDHPRAKIDFVLSGAETFIGGMRTKIENSQSSHVITPWTGNSVAQSSTNNFVKLYMLAYNKFLKLTGGHTRAIERVWSEQNSGESFKFFYFKHPKSKSCQRELWTAASVLHAEVYFNFDSLRLWFVGVLNEAWYGNPVSYMNTTHTHMSVKQVHYLKKNKE